MLSASQAFGPCSTLVAASPYHHAAPTIVPDNPPVNLSALRAVDNAGKCVLAAVDPFLPVLAAVKVGAAKQLLLCLHKKIPWYDSFVTVFDIMLRHDAIILNTLLIQEIHRVGFLKQRVPDIFFILEHFVNRFRYNGSVMLYK